jgi:hypothetical protein
MSNYSLTLSYPEHKEGSLKIDLLELKKAAVILRALNHKLRQQILRLIDENKKITGYLYQTATGTIRSFTAFSHSTKSGFC